MLPVLQRNVENPSANSKMLQNRHQEHVLRHLIAQMKAPVEAHLFRWVPGRVPKHNISRVREQPVKIWISETLAPKRLARFNEVCQTLIQVGLPGKML